MRFLAIVAVTVVALAALPALVAGVELRPLEDGWERWFSVTFDATQRHGHPVVEGYISNASPYTVGSLRVLVDGLDANGHVIDQRLAWVPGTLGGDDRLYFEILVSVAPRYRVRVFSYDRIEGVDRSSML